MKQMMSIYVPMDSAAVAVGANAVAQAITEQAAARGMNVCVVRNSTRGLFWLEPLVEIDTAAGRVGFGEIEADDVSSLLDRIAADAAASHAKHIGLVEALPYLKTQQRLTFARLGKTNPLSLTDYAAHDGWAGLKAALAIKPDDVWQAVLDSGLRGRGGAAFPAGIKWRTVAAAQAEQKYVVINADEGDSGTFADRLVMEDDPYMLIEGMTIAAIATGATKGFVYIRSEYPLAVTVFTEAIDRATAAGFLGSNILGSAHTFNIEVRMGAGSYVCGEETAMLESIEGKRGIVRAKPPIPALQGLFGKPTVVNNVLTMAAVPLILAKGAAFYKNFGMGRSTGTIPLQLAGNVKHGGLIELAFGVTLKHILDTYSGGTATGKPIKTVQVGGPLGTYLPPAQWQIPLDYETYAAIGAVVGHGGIVVHDTSSNLAKLSRYAMEFCSLESCGKCTPCRIGSTRGVEVIDRITTAATPQKREQQIGLLKDLCDTMVNGSLCAMGGMTPYPVLSALEHYPEDFAVNA